MTPSKVKQNKGNMGFQPVCPSCLRHDFKATYWIMIVILACIIENSLQAQQPVGVNATGAFANSVVLTRNYTDYENAVKNACKGNLAVKNTDETQGKAIGKDFNGTLTLPEAKKGQTWICLMTLVSDDGCEMSIDNAKPWLEEYGKGHDISKGARPWPGMFASGKTYNIKIHYSQVWYKPGVNDLDGISVILCLMPIDLAVDADRDGLVTFGTDTMRCCRFLGQGQTNKLQSFHEPKNLSAIHTRIQGASPRAA